MKRIFISLLVGVLLTEIICIGGFIKTSEKISKDVLRLHVLANSDSPEDQELKLQVRDAVLEEGKDIFGGELNVGNAEEMISLEKDRLIDKAKSIIEKNGFNYNVDVFVTDEYFNTRSYGKFSLPAGRYKAVKVTIGEAKGHNWWCVMFPPLCLPAAQEKCDVEMYLDNEEAKLIKTSPKYDMRFKIVEWYEKIKDCLKKE